MPGIPHGAFVTVQAVAAGGELQVFRRGAVFFEGVVECLAVGGDDDPVVQRVREIGRTRFGGNLFLVRKQINQFVARFVSEQVAARSAVRRLVHRDDRVDENGEVRQARLPGNRVLRLSNARVEMRGRSLRQVSSRREPDDANLLRIEIPLFRVGSGGSDG